MTNQLPSNGRSAAETQLANTLNQLPADVLDGLKRLPPEFLARLGSVSPEALESLTRLPMDLLVKLAAFSAESLEWLGRNGGQLAALPPASLARLSQMAVENSDTILTLKHISTDAVRALSRLPAEVLENLTSLAPDVLKQLPDELSATSETLNEIPKNLWDMPEDKPPVSDSTTDKLSLASMATLSELPPEAVETIAQISPEDLMTLSELPPELITTLSELPEGALGSLTMSEMATVTELDAAVLNAMAAPAKAVAEPPPQILPPTIFAQISALGPATAPMLRSLLEEARSMQELSAKQGTLKEEFSAVDEFNADPEGDTCETLVAIPPVVEVARGDASVSDARDTQPEIPALDDDSRDGPIGTGKSEDWAEGLSALEMGDSVNQRRKPKPDIDSADFNQNLDAEGLSDDGASFKAEGFSEEDDSSRTINFDEAESRGAKVSDAAQEDSYTGTVLSDDLSEPAAEGGSDEVDSFAATVQSDEIKAALNSSDEDDESSGGRTVQSDDSFNAEGLSAFDRSGEDLTMQSNNKTREVDDDSFGATVQTDGSFGVDDNEDDIGFGATVTDDSLAAVRKPGTANDDDSYGATVQSVADAQSQDDDSYGATVQSDDSLVPPSDDDSYGATIQSDDSLSRPNDDDSYGATIQSDDSLSRPNDDDSYGATIQSDAGVSGMSDDASGVTMQSEGSFSQLMGSGSTSGMRGSRSSGTQNTQGDDQSFEDSLASNDLPPDQKRSMAENWGGHVSGNDAGMTMKGAERKTKRPPVTGQSSLVITKRKMGTKAVPDFNKDRRLPEPPDPEFELLKILGEGGMGIVFEARQRSIDREVAMKMLKAKSAKDKDQRGKFLTEAVVTGELDHPNIVPIYDLGASADDALFYTMKKVEGTPWLKVVKTKPLGENLDILMRVSDAVAFAHSRGVIHRDLKPENVMLGAFGVVLVMDWGLAYSTPQFRKMSSITQNSSMGGTPAYMAPEMATGPIAKIGPHSDVYLLGAILFEIINGKPPHAGKNAMKCLMAAARNEIREPDQEIVSRNDPTGELMAIAMKAMAKEPQDRYVSVLEFQKAINEFNSHTESVTLSTRARADLKQARDSDNYNDYARAVFAFEEAFEMWNGNRVAHEGVLEAKFSYAQSAKRRGDLDLGMGLLELSVAPHKQLYDELNVEVAEREARKGRIAKLKKTVITVASIGFIAVLGALFAAETQRRLAVENEAEAIKQQGIAIKQTQEAKKQEGIAQDNLKEAKKQELLAKANEQEAIKQTSIAEAKRKEAEEAQKLEAIAKADAVKKQMEAEEAQKKEAIAKADAIKKQMEAEEAQKKEAIAKADAVKKQMEAEEAQKKEAIAKADAIKQKTLAEASAIEAKKQEAEAKKQEAEAKKQQLLAEKNADEAKKQQMLAETNAVEAKKQTVIAQKQTELAVEATKAEVYQSYIAKIGLADAKIRENAFDAAIEILKGCPPDLRNWEWGRLAYLATNSLDKFDNGAPLHSLAMSPKGDLFVTGDWNENGGQAVIWNNDTREKVRALKHDTSYVHAVAWSPNGAWIATGSADETHGYVQLWNAKTGERLPVKFGTKGVDAHAREVFSVQFSQDSTKLLTASDDTSACLWDVASGKQLKKFADGQIDLPSTTDLNGKTVARVFRFRGHALRVRSAQFSPKEDRVVTAGDDGAIVWDVATGKPSAPFSGHAGAIYAVAFSPDGSKIASGGYDKRVLVWQEKDLVQPNFAGLAAGGEVKPAQKFGALDGHTGAVWSLAFSPDGRSLLSGSEDNTIRLWNVDIPVTKLKPGESPRAGEFVKAFRGHNGHVRAVAFANGGKADLDDQLILSASRDNRIKKWSVKQYTEIRELQSKVLEGHVDAVMAAAFSRNGERIVTASSDRTARLWNAADGTLLKTFREGHDFLTSNAVYYANGKRLATTAVDNTVRVWDTDTGTQLLELKDTGRSGALAVSADGKWLLTGSSKKGTDEPYSAKIFNADTRELVASLPVDRQEVTAVAFAPSGNLALAGDSYGRLFLWNLATKQKTELKGHAPQYRINAVAFVDEKTAISASADNTVEQWDVATGQRKKESILKHGSPVNALVLHPTKRQVLTASDDQKVRLWDLDTAKVVSTLTTKFATNARLNGVSIHPTGEWALAVDAQSEKPQMHLWKLEGTGDINVAKTLDSEGALWTAIFAPDPTGQTLLALGGSEARVVSIAKNEVRMSFSPQDKVTSVAFSPKGDRIVTASWDLQARIWDANTGADKLKLGGAQKHLDIVNSAMFSPHDDGQSVLTASRDGTAKLWNATTGALLKTLNGHAGKPVRFAAFSADGAQVVTASDDATAILWSVATGKPVTTLKGHENAVVYAQFSDNGTKVITGSEDAVAVVWDAATGKPLMSLAGHTARVTSVGFAPGSSRAVTASEDGSVKLWDISQRDAKVPEPNEKPAGAVAENGALDLKKLVAAKEILTLAGHTRGVTSVTFSPDGRYVLTGSEDGRAILWLATDWTELGEKKLAITDR